jgi:hypothetical protein
MPRKSILLFIFFLMGLCNTRIFAQEEDIIPVPKKDSTKKYVPRKAIIRSALVPGLGQAYNKKYWKIPLIYAGLGTTTYLFFRNLRQYRDSRDAYRLASDTILANNELIKEPYYSVRNQPDRIRNFRNQVRQNMDYCVLWFVIIWGLNVADAAVDAHLRSFDVSDNLGVQLKPGYSPMAGTNGISLIFTFGK